MDERTDHLVSTFSIKQERNNGEEVEEDSIIRNNLTNSQAAILKSNVSYPSELDYDYQDNSVAKGVKFDVFMSLKS